MEFWPKPVIPGVLGLFCLEPVSPNGSPPQSGFTKLKLCVSLPQHPQKQHETIRNILCPPMVLSQAPKCCRTCLTATQAPRFWAPHRIQHHRHHFSMHQLTLVAYLHHQMRKHCRFNRARGTVGGVLAKTRHSGSGAVTTQKALSKRGHSEVITRITALLCSELWSSFRAQPSGSLLKCL